MASEDNELFSSPDPLNESLDSTLTRRVTRSQQQNKFVSLGASTSPRKQTFELEVGDNKSPQKLYVTVESGQSQRIGRRLFSSPSPTPLTRRRERITTTTVPLKGIDEDDTVDTEAGSLATPKKRGRPRKNDLTPKPATGKRTKTPLRKTPKPKGKLVGDAPSKSSARNTPKVPRTRRTRKAIEDTASEASVAATPRSTRTKRATKRKTVEDDADSVSQPAARKRGRGRREAMAPEEVASLADAEMSDVPAQEEVYAASSSIREPSPAESANQDVPRSEGDIWLDTLSDQATPRPNRSAKTRTLSSIIRRERSPTEDEAAPVSEGYADLRDAPSDSDSRASRETTQQPESEVDDMGAGTDVASDVVSEVDLGLPSSAAKDRDTIMQSEDFSMILVDSMHSIHDTSAALPRVDEANEEEDLGEEASLVVNRTIESIRQGLNSDKPEEEEEQPQEQEEEAQEQEMVSGDATSENPQAATETPQIIQLSPARANQSPRSGSPRRAKEMPLGRQLLTFKAMQAEHARNPASLQPAEFSPERRSSVRNSIGLNEENSNLYEDSFSEIPDAVLEAATPRRPQTHMLDMEDGQEEEDLDNEQHLHDNAEGEDESQPTPKMMATVASNRSEGVVHSNRSESGRLLTPDDTPSPVDSEAEHAEAKQTEHSTAEIDQPETRASIETQDSSSQSRSSTNEQLGDASAAENREVTPAWPESSPQLPALHDTNMLYPGNVAEKEPRPALSPIVRAGRALQSVTSDHSSPMGRRSTLGSPFRSSTNSVSRVGVMKNSAEPIPQPEPVVVSTVQVQQPTLPQSEDDPFGTSKGKTGQTSFMKALDESLRVSTQGRQSLSRASLTSSTRVTPLEEDEMSWAPTETVHLGQKGTTGSRNSSLFATLGSIANKQIDFDMDDADDEHMGQEFEADPFLAEAQRPTPRQPHQQSFGRKPNPVSRRSQLPNTWRRTSRLISLEDSSQSGRVQDQSGMEEYSLVQQKMKAPSAPQKELNTKKRVGGGIDLNSFFSSPAELPPPAPEGAREVPNKNATMAPSEVLVAPVTSTNTMFPPVSQKEFQPSPMRQRRNDLFSPAPPKATDPKLLTTSTKSSEQARPSTPEEVILPPVQQKQNFTPRPRQTGHTTPLFSRTKSPAAHSVAPTPPHMQLSRNDIEKWQEQTSVHMDDSPEDVRPPPRHRTMSPTKSCLRSPMKPRTPGRVVEFSSNALSPLQQAQARMQKVTNAPALQPRAQIQVPPPRVTKVAIAPVEEDKENTPQRNAPKGHKLLKPTGKLPRQSSRLSRTTWSRDHWLLLDKLLQLRQQGPFDFDAPRSARSAGLLGKIAAAQGVEMTLEGWHLDVVDAFKAEVGGWDEGVLAKRLFALIVGGMEKRRNGRSVARFH